MTSPDPPPFDAESYAKAVAMLLGLPLDAAYLPGVVANLQLAARMAGTVGAQALAPADEPAPVFIASRMP
jgi:hypothetical protein